MTLALIAMRSRRTLADGERTLAEAARLRGRSPSLPGRRHRRRCRVRRLELAGFDCLELVPLGVTPHRTIVYLPGGGYINPPVSQHWDLTAALAAENSARVIVARYPLAPEAEVLAVVAATADLHALLVAEDGRAPIWAGDSAGGGLALATAFEVSRRGLPAPSHLVLIAPWLDVALQNPGIEPLLARDPMLALPGLRAAGASWAREVGVDDPLVSPIRADPTGLPPTTVIVGDRDIFLADARDFTDIAQRGGVDVVLDVTPGGFHVFPAATFLPESRRARRVVAERLRAVRS